MAMIFDEMGEQEAFTALVMQDVGAPRRGAEMPGPRVQVEHLVSKYKYEADHWMHDVNDPVRVWRPEVVGEYHRGKKRAQLHAFFIVAVLEAAKELHVAGELEQNAAESPNVRDHSKADKRLIQARGRFHEAVGRLLELEAPKKKKSSSSAVQKIHTEGKT